jgi:hypothetical protein
MPRHILSEQQIHPAIRDTVSRHERTIVEAVQGAIAEHRVVVVGMRFNPFPRKAGALLDGAGIAYRDLECGGHAELKALHERGKPGRLPADG